MSMFELDRLLSYDDAAILAELRRVSALVNSPFLTKRTFDRHGKVHSSTICTRFGSWQQALNKAGLESRSAQTPEALTAIRQRFSDEELLQEIRLVAGKIEDKPLTQEIFNELAQMNAFTIRHRLGGWSKALKKAGVAVHNKGRRYSEDDYFENLLAVWTHYGRQPKYGEMDLSPSIIPVSAYEHKWRGWRKALLAFLERVNSDVRMEETEASPIVELPNAQPLPRPSIRRSRVKQEDQRQIKLGLRYNVLKRDRFRCVLCGVSPSTNLGCVLHVDHVLAWSKGGKTILENLRTLCESCNLGKSDKLELENHL